MIKKNPRGGRSLKINSVDNEVVRRTSVRVISGLAGGVIGFVGGMYIGPVSGAIGGSIIMDELALKFLDKEKSRKQAIRDQLDKEFNEDPFADNKMSDQEKEDAFRETYKVDPESPENSFAKS